MKKLQIAGLALFLIACIAMLAMQSDWGNGSLKHSSLEALSESGFQVEIGKFEGTFPHAVDLKDAQNRVEYACDLHRHARYAGFPVGASKKRTPLYGCVSERHLLSTQAGIHPLFRQRKGLVFSVRMETFPIERRLYSGWRES